MQRWFHERSWAGSRWLNARGAGGPRRRDSRDLARAITYDALRVDGVSVAAVLAAAWLLERTAGFPNPTARSVAWLSAHPTLPLGALALCAVIARAVARAPRTT